MRNSPLAVQSAGAADGEQTAERVPDETAHTERRIGSIDSPGAGGPWQRRRAAIPVRDDAALVVDRDVSAVFVREEDRTAAAEARIGLGTAAPINPSASAHTTPSNPEISHAREASWNASMSQGDKVHRRRGMELGGLESRRPPDAQFGQVPLSRTLEESRKACTAPF